MTPEDVKQIIDALEQQDWVQWVKTQMKAQAAQEKPGSNGETQTYAEEPEEPPASPPAPVPPTPPVPPVQPEAGVPPVKYSRMAAELDQLRRQVAAVEGQLKQERTQRVNVERYSALAELRRTRLFDLDKEAERCDYAKMSDEQFAAHLETIEQNYREIPLGVPVPSFDLPAAHAPGRPGAKADREKYFKEVRDRALQIGKQRAMKGEDVDYQTILEEVAAGKH
jgi:type IV secretory pathway VirB10-like protein